MDVEWSTILQSEHPWYQGVKLYTISRGAKHNSESQQRYLNCRDLENFIQKTYEEEESSITEVVRSHCTSYLLTYYLRHNLAVLLRCNGDVVFSIFQIYIKWFYLL